MANPATAADTLAEAPPPQKEYRIKPPGKFSLNLKELWEYRELFYFFTWRLVKVKYKQTLLGFTWAVLQPFMMMVVFTLVFGRGMGVEEKTGGVPYPIFAYSGLMIWHIFANGMNQASNSMIANAAIIRKIYFPRMVIPMSGVLSALFDFLMALLVYVGLLLYFQWPVDPLKLLMLPLAVLMAGVSTFGIGTLIAALNVKYRDFRHITPYMIRLLMFLTPVIYPVKILDTPWLETLLYINPMAGAVDLARNAIIDNPLPMTEFTISFVSMFVFVLLGIYVFRRTEHYFADLA
jgi:lipopolysaccharide transport system permease protein